MENWNNGMYTDPVGTSSHQSHNLTMTLFAITIYGQCCRRHVVGQRVVSNISVLRSCWSICSLCSECNAYWDNSGDVSAPAARNPLKPRLHSVDFLAHLNLRQHETARSSAIQRSWFAAFLRLDRSTNHTLCCSEANASVPGTSNKVGEWVS